MNKDNLIKEISKKKQIKVQVVTNFRENKIISYDKEKDIFKIGIREEPVKGKANKELIKFLKKLLKKNVEIIKGEKNKLKILRID